MKRVALFAVGAALVSAAVWLLLAQFVQPVTVTTNWPPDPARVFPGTVDNESGAMLRRFGAPLDPPPPLRRAMTTYIAAQLGNGTTEAAPPPREVAEFLARQSAAIAELRDQLESEPPRWAVDVQDVVEPPEAPMGAAMRASALLIADGLARRAGGDTATAGRDFEAVFRIGRALSRRPEAMSQMVALSPLRLANGAAAKLPLPRPDWHRELASIDVRRTFQRAYAYEAWRAREYARRHPAGEPDESRFRNTVRRATEPLLRLVMLARVERDVDAYHQLSEMLIPEDACASAPLPPRVPNLESVRRRAARFRIEREGVANLFALRAGEPMPRDSACRAARWEVKGDALVFPRAMPAEPSQIVVVPLAWRVPAGR